MDKTSNKYWALGIYLALTLATLATYQQVRNYDFVNYDDPQYVYENRHVKAGITYESFIWASSTGHVGNWHPLTWLSHMLDCQLFGTNPRWHHLINLLLHIANTLLIFVVFRQMTGKLWPSAFIAALLALHPLHVESVAWISGRKDVLSTLFWLLTMAAYLRYVKKPETIRYLLALLTFTLGLMAKPMLVTLPLVLLMLDYWPLNRFQQTKNLKGTNQRQILYRLLREKIPFFALSSISSIVTFLVQRSAGAVAEREWFHLTICIANAFISYLTYVEKMFWPCWLAAFYPHPLSAVSMRQAAFAALLLLAISIWVIRLARSHRYLLTGWLWYLVTLVPVIGLVQVGEQALADRYTYVPLTGLFIIIAWGVPDLLAKWNYQKIVLGASTLIVLSALSICTHFQLRHWRNSITLFEHTISVTKNNYLAHYNLALALYADGRVSEAITHLREVHCIKPSQIDPMYMLAWLLATHRQTRFYNPQEAIQLAKRACELTDYKESGLLDTLAAAYAAAGKFSEAVATAEKAVQLAQQSGQNQPTEEIRSRLFLYKAGQPYIEPLRKAPTDCSNSPL